MSSQILPESARFYAASGQQEKAVKMLETVARNNKVELPPGKLQEVQVVSGKVYSRRG